MRYWLDTEFIDDGERIRLLSIGMVAQDGRELYREVWPAPIKKASPWVRENVLPHLVHLNHGEHVSWTDFPSCPRGSREWIAIHLQEFCNPEKYGPPEFWGWCAAYDWVVLCQLFGTMMDKPAGWPSYIRDLQYLLDEQGVSDETLYANVPSGNHHALADARQLKAAWEFLRERVSRD